MTASYVYPAAAPERDALRRAISAAYLADETALVNKLLGLAALPPEHASLVVRQAADWVERVRRLKNEQSPLDAFMQQYDLSSEEGVLLMCLAEALLRIPDDATADKLIADKLGDADWESHFGKSDSLFVNAGTWGLMLTGKIVKLAPDTTSDFRRALNKLVAKSTEPVIQLAVRQAMRLMGSQFVMGRTIGEALKNARSKAHRAYLHSYDMLGEAALTSADAERYFKAYQDAIAAIGKAVREDAVFASAPVYGRPNISVKLSALHPRYELAQRERVLRELTPKLLALAQQAKAEGIGLTVDAEEADRLELSLDLIEAVYADDSLAGYEGFGLAVQAFQKRGLAVIDWLEQLARRVGRRLAVRLVKGAYWDTEVKRSQEQGLAGYPVYTRKANTDVAYLACARRLLAAREVFYPMLATHNAHSVAAVRAYAGDELGYEFQRLHGMGEALYQVVKEDLPVPCRVYSPVGSHEDLLPYLVRRLLENGANTSFVNRIFDDNTPPEALVADPVEAVRALPVKTNPHLPLPSELYGAERRNSAGLFLTSEPDLAALATQLTSVQTPMRATSITASLTMPGETHPVSDPADRRRTLGEWTALQLTAIPTLVADARRAQPGWNALSADARALVLERAADRLEAEPALYLRLLLREAGKTLADANAEVREAVDFLRYYAAQARKLMSRPTALPGPTGEHNELQLHGKGLFVCISPWNFPLAIFAGQIAAALAAGNAVIAKPAEQTNLIAYAFTSLLHEAGVPRAVLQLALGDGLVGGALVGAEGVIGVAFTGSVEVAQKINRSLAARPGPIATLIAETGGQNAMIVDSSALPEQVVKDAIHSAFYSAGQRCSALRLLCVQEEIADKVSQLLAGAMQELVPGDPALLATDIGPVIDEEARDKLLAHAARMRAEARLIGELPLPTSCAHGSFVAPLAVELDNLAALREEQFGPILHLLRYRADQLDALIDQINGLGYGLTLGVHSRIERTWRRVQARTLVGNSYINRGMTGAVVGVQPFGGEGLSGTGPKAGGPHYLLRFVTERTLSVNTSAVGGNARLLAASA
ncbi:bifunctional proline dehydrogenase/L-glutamate gamma-semialdehyde dehydrogenase PutA [Stagnimonas aquatica]|uniref:Bifunctional protein PutA n=1 Tax=Stagnimonas aquatica TaxID=2689987 RepID=A0A3N0VGE0_9GAMM|nr:bifunctional proline dehydrogenase/L-glutamate gamma-semialdehyde dehydrogenase PutA [Stagnimonas aquatica]ROH91853.1 bifunctional proline dehydrogenase/L-glutamate gamma-semialdehyde dehydrogenase PutA [Stagnimonas aquatica]